MKPHLILRAFLIILVLGCGSATVDYAIDEKMGYACFYLILTVFNLFTLYENSKL